MRIAGAVFGIIGALEAFPRRLAAREVEARGGRLRRGLTRATTHVVFGRTLAARQDEPGIEARFDAAVARGNLLLSENGFLRTLGLIPPVAGAGITRRALLDQSGLGERNLDLLMLFDAFEREAEPFTFRDLILARKYAGLIGGGASWGALVRSIHQAGPVASLTALSLHGGRPNIYARRGGALSELDGQHLLALGEPGGDDPDTLFAQAEDAEGEERFADAAALYGRCLALDPSDSVAAFNRGNCLRAAGRPDEAANAYMAAIRRDPGLAEAWFNFAELLTQENKTDAARRHLLEAVEIDPTYADPVFNLATLAYRAGDLAEARRWWSRYLDLDATSEWAHRARKGIRYADIVLSGRTGTEDKR